MQAMEGGVGKEFRFHPKRPIRGENENPLYLEADLFLGFGRM